MLKIIRFKRMIFIYVDVFYLSVFMMLYFFKNKVKFIVY